MPVLKWYHSLKFKLSFVLLLGLVTLVSSVVWFSVTSNRDFAQNDLSRWLQQFGDNIVADLSAQLAAKSALTVSLAAAGASLPAEEDLFLRVFPALIDFYGDSNIAGGGVWPEPHAFDPERQKRSFFWGRDADGKLRYYNDYNEAESGYHHEDWYVVGRHLARGQAYWSKSYIDPYSLQPMVTCSVGMYNSDGEFKGVATVDVKLEGLQSFTEYWQKKTGGYVFITDQYNRLLSFPNPQLIQRRTTTDNGGSSLEFLDARALAAENPRFSPIAAALDLMNQHLLRSAAQMPAYRQEVGAELGRASSQINEDQANLSAAIMMNPLVRSTYFKRFFIADDFITQQPSYVYTFYVPGTYWKLVIVKPAEELSAVTAKLERSKLLYSALAAVPILAVVWFLLDWLVFAPLGASVRKLNEVSQLDARQDWEGLSQCNRRLSGRGEPALVAAVLRQLVNSLERQRQEAQSARVSYENKLSHQREREEMLVHQNNELEIQVEELLRARKHSLSVTTGLPQTGGGRSIADSGGGAVLLTVSENCLLLSLDTLPDNQGMTQLLKQFQYQPFRHLILELSRLSQDTEASRLASHVQALLLGGIRPIVVGLPPNLATSLGQSGLLKPGQVQAHPRLPDALRQVLGCPEPGATG